MRALSLDPRRWFAPKPAPARGRGRARDAGPAPLVRAPEWRGRLAWILRRHRRLPLALAALLVVGATGALLHWRGAALGESVSQSLGQGLARVSVAAGFTLDSVVVVGRARTDRDQIRDAIGVARGGPILAIDPEAVRERLESLDWIDHALVRRVLPGRVEIEIHEAVPFAIWQQDGRFTLIDSRGRKITEQNVEAYAHLPLVVGQGAAEKAAELFAMLQTQPTLKNRVQAAVRVGDRRWNIRFDNGVDLMLPETDPAEAWNRFAVVEQEQRLLARAISHVDMRFRDRLVVRLTDEGLKTLRVPGRST